MDGIEQAEQGVGTAEGLSGMHGESRRKRNEKPNCIGYSEIDKYAVQTYQKHYPDHKNHGDITKIQESALPDFDILVGGFPCQSFSVAGKRGGFADTRGTLFFDIARIVKAKQPRLLLLENVKGLLSHDKGRTFRVIISALDELGYDIQWQVLNSKDFGVPQNRERVLVVGHLRGTPRPEVFPFAGTDEKDTRVVGQDVAYTIDANYAKGTNTLANSRRSIVKVNDSRHDYERIYSSDGIAPTINTGNTGNAQPKIFSNPHGFNKGGQKDFPNVRSSTNHNEFVNAIRRLTPMECERLQGFPDNWTEGVSDTQRYKQCGNAVTVNVIQAVIKRIFSSSAI